MTLNPIIWLRSGWRRVTGGLVTSVLGTAMLHTAQDLRQWAALAPSLPADQDRAEVRLQATFITAAFLLLLLEPVFYIFLVPESLITRVSALAPSRWCVIGAFGLAFLGTLPHLWTLLFRPDLLGVTRFRVWATFSALGASVVWIVLANLAVPLDVGGLEWPYGVRALVTLFIAGIYAFSVNAQQVREVLHAAHD